MPVQDPAGGAGNSIGEHRDYSAHGFRMPRFRRFVLVSRRSVIDQTTRARAEFTLESDQTSIFQAGPAKINRFRSFGFALCNQFPEQKRHAAEFVKLFVRASILVND